MYIPGFAVPELFIQIPNRKSGLIIKPLGPRTKNNSVIIKKFPGQVAIC